MAAERFAAVVAMGISRDRVWRDTLASLAEPGGDETADESLREAAAAALAVLEGGRYSELTDWAGRAGDDELVRLRLFDRF